MTDEPATRDLPTQAPLAQAAQQARQVARRKVYRPTVTVTKTGVVMADSCPIGRVQPGPSGPMLVVQDRCPSRCRKRGTNEIVVDMGELADAAREAMEGEPPPPTNT